MSAKKEVKLRVVIEPDGDTYLATCPDLPGCITWGYTEKEAEKYIKEAVELYLEDMIADGEALPYVGQVGGIGDINIVLVKVEFSKEVQKMCEEFDLRQYMDALDAVICVTYPNVTKIRHRVLDMGDYKRLRFETHTSGEVKDILEAEKQVHLFMFENVPEAKQEFFSVTYLLRSR